MKITLDISPDERAQGCVTSNALAGWYAEHPVVLRLWAIRPAGDEALRVIVLLEPSLDGNEISPAWMAHGSRWLRDLRERLGTAVQLERIDGPLPGEFEIDGEGTVLWALSWRDSTVLET